MNTMTIKALEDIPVMGGLDDSPRGRVLRAAAHLFRHQGYNRTTVRDLARVVGIQSGSLFHHFSSKEDILCAVMEEAIRYNFARMKAAMAEAITPQLQLRALIRGELESILGPTGEAMAVLVYEWNALTPERQLQVLALRDEYEAAWLQVLTQLQQQGIIQHPPFFWRRLLAGAIAWTGNWYRPEKSMTLDDLTDMVLDMALAGRAQDG